MFIFPLIYIFSFLFALKDIFKGSKQAFFLFLIFGLSIYTTAMSVAFQYGFKNSISILQSFKELIIIGLLAYLFWTYKAYTRLHFIDYAIAAYFSYTLIYALLPIGDQDFLSRMIAFKGTSFFLLVYLTGRLFDPVKVFINKYFLFILILAVATAAVVVLEVLSNQHLQSISGYADYNYYFFNFEKSGNYELTWTFETEGGFKRFAGFFANPLEHAGATLISLSIILSLYTDDQERFKPDRFGWVAIVGTLISIFFAISRASFISYFLIIYVYARLSNKKVIIKLAHTGAAVFIIYLIVLFTKDNYTNNGLQEMIINTLNFSNSSSIGHLVEWVQGLTSMVDYPLGLGLGTSGRVAGSLGENIGGENQFIIVGVQLGVIALAIYIAIYTSIIRTAKFWYSRLAGKEKKVCLAILLIKIGFIIPLFTSELESSPYLSYMIWFLTGIFVAIISVKDKKAAPNV